MHASSTDMNCCKNVHERSGKLADDHVKCDNE